MTSGEIGRIATNFLPEKKIPIFGCGKGEKRAE
jgi:hypothetical protein